MKFCYIVGVWILAVLCGCASVVPTRVATHNNDLLARALSGELILGRPYTPQELPDVELFELTPEMKAFASAAVQGVNAPDKKAEALHSVLMTAEQLGGRGITYSAYTTISGEQAFAMRQANCLSYTLLYVAMARHVGLKAEVNEVMLPPTWDMREGDNFLLMRHVNAKVFMPSVIGSWARPLSNTRVTDIVVDLEMRRFRTHYKQQIIGNDLVAAQFYSNRGMELAAEGKTEAAFLHLRKALVMSDKPSYIWSNLGSFYLRQKHYAEAEAVYLHGLGINPRDYTIMNNLAGLYAATGNETAQRYYQERVRKHRNANPYYMYRQAQDAVAQQDYQKALPLIKGAIRKEKDEIRFYRLAASIYEALGDTHNAELMRDKVYQLGTIRF